MNFPTSGLPPPVSGLRILMVLRIARDPPKVEVLVRFQVGILVR